MDSLATVITVLALSIGAAMAVMAVARRLPARHLDEDSREAVKLGLGVVATLTALVLGLLVTSAKADYDAQDGAVKEMASDASLLDAFLAHYGPEAGDLRGQLRQVIAAVLEGLWPGGDASRGQLKPGEARGVGDRFYRKLADLEPKNDAQRAIKARSMDLVAEMAKVRHRMYVQKDGSIPTPFLVILVLWIVAFFAGFGLLAPRNPTVVVVLAISAASIAAALFLILELERPFAGAIRVSPDPLRDVFDQIGR